VPHEDKTRLIEFGRLPALARRQRGERRPGTFAFLGFTHYCGWTRDGRFIVKRKTQSQRLTRKLKALRQEASRHMHATLAEQHRWYSSILRGALRLLRCVAQLPGAERIPWGGSPDMAAVPPAPEPEGPVPELGSLQRDARTLSSARSKDHPPLDDERGMTRVTLGKSRVRESRMPGSVRAKPNGLATRPPPAWADDQTH